MSWVLVEFRVSLFEDIQRLKSWSYLKDWNLLKVGQFCWLGEVERKEVHTWPWSAKRLPVAECLGKGVGMSAVYKIKSRGPKTEPCRDTQHDRNPGGPGFTRGPRQSFGYDYDQTYTILSRVNEGSLFQMRFHDARGGFGGLSIWSC